MKRLFYFTLIFLTSSFATIAQERDPFKYKLDETVSIEVRFIHNSFIEDPIKPNQMEDDFFDDTGDAISAESQLVCQQGGITGALNCQVVEVINQARQDAQDKVSAAMQNATRKVIETAEMGENGLGQSISSTLELNLKPKITKSTNGDYFITLDVYGKTLFAGDMSDKDLIARLNNEAYNLIPADLRDWKIQFTQQSIDDYYTYEFESIYIDLSDQFKSASLYELSSDAKLKVNIVAKPDPKVDEVLLLDDQFGTLLKDGELPSKDYRYPFDKKGGKTGSEVKRHLLLVGTNLEMLDNSSIKFNDKYITYKIIEQPQHLKQVYHNLAHEYGTQAHKDDEDIVLVQAQLFPDIQGGLKELNINNKWEQWNLGFKGVFARLSYERPGEDADNFTENTFYDGETIKVGLVSANKNVNFVGSEIQLEAVTIQGSGENINQTRRDLGTIAIEAQSIENETVDGDLQQLLSESFLLVVGDNDQKYEIKDGEKPVYLKEGEKIVASSADPYSFISTPPGVLANILSAPVKSALWDDALLRASKCNGAGYIPNHIAFTDFASRESEVVTKWLLTHKNTKTNISYGDHAALILIRDFLLPMVQERLPEMLKWMPGKTGDGPSRLKALEFYAKAGREPNSANDPFWKARTATFAVDTGGTPMSGPVINHIERPLSYTFDIDQLISDKVLKGSRAIEGTIRSRQDAFPVIAQAVEKELRAQYNEAILAIGHGTNALDCNLDVLSVIAGQRSEKVVEKILPLLIEKVDGRWQPDYEARRYVRSVYVLGNELRAAKALESIDDIYKSLAVAMASAGLAAGGSAIASAGWAANAGSIASGLTVAVDLADAAYFGSKAINGYNEGERDYYTALGLSPVLGADQAIEAKKNRQSLAATGLSLIAPGISSFTALRSIKSLKNIEDGRALFRSGATYGANDLENLKLDAYYQHLRNASDNPVGIVRNVTNSEAEDLRNLSNMRETALANRRSASEAANTEIAVSDSTPRSADNTQDIPPAPREVNTNNSDIIPNEASPDVDLEATRVVRTDPDKTIAVGMDFDETVAVRSGSEATPSAPNRGQAALDSPTVRVDPGSLDIDDMATVNVPSPPNPNRPAVIESGPSGQLPEGQVDLLQSEAGARLEELGILPENIDDIIARGRNGEALTTDEILTKIDYLRVMRELGN